MAANAKRASSDPSVASRILLGKAHLLHPFPPCATYRSHDNVPPKRGYQDGHVFMDEVIKFWDTMLEGGGGSIIGPSQCILRVRALPAPRNVRGGTLSENSG